MIYFFNSLPVATQWLTDLMVPTSTNSIAIDVVKTVLLKIDFIFRGI